MVLVSGLAQAATDTREVLSLDQGWRFNLGDIPMPVIKGHGDSYNNAKGGKALVKIDCFGSRLRTFDVDEAIGCAVCGDDHVWHWASGKLIGTDRVELTCDMLKNPVAVRYAWANNPVCNLTSLEGLPVTPFRTDKPEP